MRARAREPRPGAAAWRCRPGAAAGRCRPPKPPAGRERGARSPAVRDPASQGRPCRAPFGGGPRGEPHPPPRTRAPRGSRRYRAYLFRGRTNSLRATLTASAIAAMCTTTPTTDACMTSSRIFQLMAKAESDGASTISATAVPRNSSVLVESPAPPPPLAPNVARAAPAAIKTKSAGAVGNLPAPRRRGRSRARGGRRPEQPRRGARRGGRGIAPRRA